MVKQPQVAVILSGCGVYDGSEIHEAVFSLLAIDREGAVAHCFAPDKLQQDVIDHKSGTPTSEKRNVLVESARIARGKIQALNKFDPQQFDAMVFPGGFGAAKNLCNYAQAGIDCQVDEDVVRAIRSMHSLGKPIAALCIAPVLLARVLGNIDLTIGSDSTVAGHLTAMGAKHFQSTHGKVVTDHNARLVTSPCYMLESRISEIADDAALAVKSLLAMI